jgi:hypothetical protein
MPIKPPTPQPQAEEFEKDERWEHAGAVQHSAYLIYGDNGTKENMIAVMRANTGVEDIHLKIVAKARKEARNQAIGECLGVVGEDKKVEVFTARCERCGAFGGEYHLPNCSVTRLVNKTKREIRKRLEELKKK